MILSCSSLESFQRGIAWPDNNAIEGAAQRPLFYSAQHSAHAAEDRVSPPPHTGIDAFCANLASTASRLRSVILGWAYQFSEYNWLELIDKLSDAHPLIAPYFCSGAGLMLQRLDAEIMREALIYLAEKNIPALPIHDSAIVAAHHKSELHTAMSLGYHYIFGDRFTCGISEKWRFYFLNRRKWIE